jgi:DNA polymerase III alpha subunit
LSTTEPIWELLGDFGFVSMLAHVHDHFDIVKSIAPKSVIDLAIVLALIRPGKRHLVGESREVIDKEIWNQPKDGSYFFKKSHAVAFAVSIIIQMNLLVEQA